MTPSGEAQRPRVAVVTGGASGIGEATWSGFITGQVIGVNGGSVL